MQEALYIYKKKKKVLKSIIITCRRWLAALLLVRCSSPRSSLQGIFLSFLASFYFLDIFVQKDLERENELDHPLTAARNKKTLPRSLFLSCINFKMFFKGNKKIKNSDRREISFKKVFFEWKSAAGGAVWPTRSVAGHTQYFLFFLLVVYK